MMVTLCVGGTTALMDPGLVLLKELTRGLTAVPMNGYVVMNGYLMGCDKAEFGDNRIS